MAWDAALSVQEFIYRIITSIIILLTGFGIGIFINKALRRLFEELKLNQLVSRIYINFNLELWISRLASYFIYL